MKKLFIFFTALFLSLNFSQAQKLGDTVLIGKDTYMLVREINGVKQNSTFQQNVAIMNSYANALKNAKEQLGNKNLSKEDAEGLKMKIQEIEDMYLSNNAAMTKAYNFAVERQYMQEYDDLFVSTYLSEQEIDNLQFADGTLLDLDKIAEEDSRKIYRQKRIQGKGDVTKFQRELFSFLNAQVELKNMQELLLKTDDVLDKNNISAKISALNNSLEAAKKHLFEDYDMNPNRDYFVELNSCKLYLLLTEKEIAAKKK